MKITVSEEELGAQIKKLRELVEHAGVYYRRIEEMLANGELIYQPKHKACGSYLMERWELGVRKRKFYVCPKCDVSVIVKGKYVEVN